MAKVLILAGDAAEDLETMYIKYRLVEAGHEPYVAAPTTRPIKLVVHDFEPDFDTYVEKTGRSGSGFVASPPKPPGFKPKPARSIGLCRFLDMPMPRAAGWPFPSW